MSVYVLTEIEEKLVETYKQTKDSDIALYFFNKLGKDILSIVYSKVNVKFASIPFEREDLVSMIWKSLTKVLVLYKKDKGSLWNIWIENSYFTCLKEIEKYFKNTELILNYADSYETFQNTHCVVVGGVGLVEYPKQPFRDTLEPIIEYVSHHNKTYSRFDIKKVMYLKSFGYSEREIAKKMNVSRRYISSMIKIILRISKRYLSTSNR